MEYFNDYEEFDETFKRASEVDVDAIVDMLNYFSLISSEDSEPGMIRMLKAHYIDQLVDASKSVGWIRKGEYLIANAQDEEDLNAALRCYLRAAMFGDTFGFDLIGDMYYRGEITDCDYEMSWIFFWLSIEYSKVPNTLSLCRIGQMFKYGQRVDVDIEFAKNFFIDAIEAAGEYADIDDYALLARQELAELG